MIQKLRNIGKEKNVSSLLTNVVIAFLGLLSFMLLTRQLSKELFGDWVLFITLATFVDLLRFGLTRTSVVRLLAGADKERFKNLLGSSCRINLILLGLICIFCWGVLGFLNYSNISLNQGYKLFLTWYPLLALCNLGWNTASALFQAEQNFNRMMFVRFANIGLFVVFLIGNGLWFNLGLLEIVWVNLAVNLISSLWCTIKKWDGLVFLKYADKTIEKELINFGKYSMGTLIGSSLLKSADTLIIGLSPILGSAGIAMYAIPLKLTDLLGIPLRSFTMTAYPRMSKKAIAGDLDGVRKIFYSYSGAITLLFIPVAIFCFVFAEYLILILGGDAYADSLPLLTLVFRVFTVYTLLLPIDRFTGVLLDSINKPKLNLYKVIFMTIANILIDVLAVFVFESLVMVAVGTVLFTLLGIFLGFYFLRKEIQIQSKQILPEGIFFFKNLNAHIGK
ncbi:oligosaccharide flippase family protein [Croceitalea rosinachiae]|uniref:Oligosaccharide flippase family protein n=1 Tax=Croceitalea rosinachiae TaxID=3075596 RepID=A0ABU3AA21_9FLAO|nr:oligosaccharide flippase family protein [Croceitalea sp. F388]MDT0605791.1 oligosaccharide flippase family protein [Croceitalea sp. F388]